MDKKPFLTGHSINLIVPELDVLDVSEWASWYNDLGLTEFNSHGVQPVSIETERQFIKSCLNDPCKLVLAVVTRRDNILVGNICLQNISYFNRSAEIAITMGRNAPISASMEAMGLMVSHGFCRLNLNRIYAGADEGLSKWIEMTQMVGFKVEGIERDAIYRDNRFRDKIIFSVIRGDYDALMNERENNLIYECSDYFMDEMKRISKIVFRK